MVGELNMLSPLEGQLSLIADSARDGSEAFYGRNNRLASDNRSLR